MTTQPVIDHRGDSAPVAVVDDYLIAERDEARTARNSMTEMDRASRHPYAHLGMCGDRDDARDER